MGLRARGSLTRVLELAKVADEQMIVSLAALPHFFTDCSGRGSGNNKEHSDF